VTCLLVLKGRAYDKRAKIAIRIARTAAGGEEQLQLTCDATEAKRYRRRRGLGGVRSDDAEGWSADPAWFGDHGPFTLGPSHGHVCERAYTAEYPFSGCTSTGGSLA